MTAVRRPSACGPWQARCAVQDEEQGRPVPRRAPPSTGLTTVGAQRDLPPARAASVGLVPGQAVLAHRSCPGGPSARVGGSLLHALTRVRGTYLLAPWGCVPGDSVRCQRHWPWGVLPTAPGSPGRTRAAGGFAVAVGTSGLRGTGGARARGPDSGPRRSPSPRPHPSFRRARPGRQVARGLCGWDLPGLPGRTAAETPQQPRLRRGPGTVC